jgi:hypothetical protein
MASGYFILVGSIWHWCLRQKMCRREKLKQKSVEKLLQNFYRITPYLLFKVTSFKKELMKWTNIVNAASSYKLYWQLQSVCNISVLLTVLWQLLLVLSKLAPYLLFYTNIMARDSFILAGTKQRRSLRQKVSTEKIWGQHLTFSKGNSLFFIAKNNYSGKRIRTFNLS